MYTLGINAVYHDCSACLICDGKVIAAAEEERFNHIKHGKRPLPFTTWQLPFNAIDYCLAEADITLAEVDHIAYSFDPEELHGYTGGTTITLPLQPSATRPRQQHASPWDPLFLSYIVNAPRQLLSGAPLHLQKRFRGLSLEHIQSRWHFVEHHFAHEASAFLAAPFDDMAVLIMDGRGERVTTSFGVFRDGRYTRIKHIDLPDSLGLLYEEVTDYLGFLRSSDEYKVMALASFGKPAHLDAFHDIVKLQDGGGYRIVAPQLVERFGPARERGGPLTQNHYDIAHSLQKVLEKAVLHMAAWLQRETDARNLAMAGGVALNCVMNARVRDSGMFDQVWVQPAAGDAGTALGAALWVDYEQRARNGDRSRRWSMQDAYLGPCYGDGEIERFLTWTGVPFRRLNDVAGETAVLLSRNKVIGWYQGRMEFGPRALGARSILASPIDPAMQAKLNEIKDREDFRPVAPVVMEERASQWFIAKSETAPLVAPFMLFVFDVRPEVKSKIPAVCHVDGTARVQTVRRDQHARYYDLLAAFERLTGVPILVNTSFNTRGEPVVCTPRDAVECFWTSPLDALVIGSFLIEKPAS
ncbi:MAG TPA: carbamoyltransferase C-terminal domain-containing protein [Rhodocyclaceae bacterium]|nr:carbamoyltransferase C-terminal domain-containing protein [Rhodocyclaceae bacterium]